jgi:hypothetical protein
MLLRFEILSVIYLLSNRLCPIIVVIVNYSDIGMYSRYFDPVTGNQHHSESINIIHHKNGPDSDLAYGFRRPIAITVMSRDKQIQFLQIGSKWAIHVVTPHCQI